MYKFEMVHLTSGPESMPPILRLSPELLTEIFQHLSCQQNVQTCPLVCKAFRLALCSPSACWTYLDLTRTIHPSGIASAQRGPGLNLAALQDAGLRSRFLAWMQQRGSSAKLIRAALGAVPGSEATEYLMLMLSKAGPQCLETLEIVDQPGIPSGIAASLISTLFPQFQSLRVLDLALVGTFAQAEVSSLALLPNLTWLELGFGDGVEEEGGGFAFSSLSPLSSLTRIDYLGLGGGGLSHIQGADALVAALPANPSLEDLSIFGGNLMYPPSLAGFTNLTGVHLRQPFASLPELHWHLCWVLPDWPGITCPDQSGPGWVLPDEQQPDHRCTTQFRCPSSIAPFEVQARP
ncbi:hypothetical protein WJX84_009369 [Apatococcus fuscideae]|uniref:F-box domain-containing protein n=1 Tax=Apatococcus fuscideae TaxID=2026836 RepID=A0AAW1T3W9_9CHLO